jgi:hypothetical protein
MKMTDLDTDSALREQQNGHCQALMLYRDEHGVGRFPLSDRIYTPIVNCHEVKMNFEIWCTARVGAWTKDVLYFL